MNSRPSYKRGRRPLLLLGLLLVVPGTASAQSSATGEATTENVILSVSVAGRDVSIASDVAESESRATQRAHASFVAGATSDSKVGVAQRTATTGSEGGTDKATVGALSLDDLLALTVVDAGVDVEVADGAVSSSAAAVLADVEVLDGLIDFEGLSTTSATSIDQQLSSTSRTIALDGVSVMRVGSFLEQLGIDPHSLACEAVEEAGATLGVATADACEELDDAHAAIDDAAQTLSAASSALGTSIGGAVRDDVEADKASAEAMVCGALDAVCIANALADLLALATEYSITLSDPTNLGTTRAEVVATLDDLLIAIDDSAAIDDALAAVADETCAKVDAAVADVLAAVSDQDPANISATLPPIRDELDAACDALRSILGALLGTSLLSFDGVEITLDASAADGSADSSVGVSIGSIKVGLNESTEVGIEDVEAVAEAIGPQIEQFFADLGFGFSAPDIELLTIAKEHGQDGAEWYADASLTTLRLTVPGDPLTIPDEAPLGVLDDGSGTTGAMHAGMFGVSAGAVLAGVVEAPETVVEAGIFSVGSRFTPAGAADDPDGDDDPDGEADDDDRDVVASGDGPGAPVTLPSTGLAVARSVALGLLLLVAGAHLRRVVLAR